MTNNIAAPKKVAIFGSTGSIGTQTLDIVRKMTDGNFKIVALSANSNAAMLAEQCNEFRPERVHLNEGIDILRRKISYSPSIEIGDAAMWDMATNVDCDLLVMGISGCAGIRPTINAANAGKRIALANKESVVSAGPLLKRAVSQHGANIIPIDSEHNAIYQCLTNLPMVDQGKAAKSDGDYILSGIIPLSVMQGVRRLYITSSGGPFADVPLEQMQNITIQDALNHPVWSMGSKITIDSATMMNKGLEVIEAHLLFGVPYENIQVLIHRQCLVHSMVEFVDSSVIAQLYLPDMKLPIAYALNWPRRANNNLPPLDLVKQPITFTNPDFEKFPSLKLAFDVGKKGGLHPAILNAANEVANAAFRNSEIGYHDIYKINKATVDAFQPTEDTIESLEQILQADQWARVKARELIKTHNQ